MRTDLSADPRIRVFDRIAWVYALLYHVQRLGFRRGFAALRPRLGLPTGARVLEIGCGTGALASVLLESGFDVRAVDASPRMIATARRLLREAGHHELAARMCMGNPLQGLDFPDRHFDLVLATHVVHGMPAPQRRQFFLEARRVSCGLALFYDYAPRALRGPRPLMRVLEGLERSDYRCFRRRGLEELRWVFSGAEVVAASRGSAWYLCRWRP